EIIDDLEQDGDFGSQIRKKGLVKDIVNEINSKSNVPSDKMVLAFDFIKDDMKWNGQYSKYPTTNLREALENKSGNSADINLALVLLLRELGLQADPVILSTRNNGYIHKNFPSINKMNDVIALVALEGKDYFLDATSRMRSIGMLPFSCLNGEGLLVSKERMRWVSLLQDEKDNSLYFADFNILPSGEVNGNLQVSESGYSAVNDRINFSKNGSDNFKKSIKEEFTDWTLEDISLENIENPKETLKYTIRMNSQDIIQVSDSLLYLNVLLNMGRKTNPFLREQRDYPVDFGCPQKDSYVFNYEIPEGYVVKSLPEPLKISLPDQSGSFKFIIAINGKKISVNSQITINKALYLDTDYNDLRNFFNKIAEKHAQQIVLKKI
ncbi:MAG: transglutaminase domain-containing protein, partial [Bacteroidota bacterium]|nr:transglutaminase domain-containing protein [Bacteroidota bacterium]